MLKALKESLKATEIMFLLGLLCIIAGIWLLFGYGWSLIAAGIVLLIAAFQNAAQRGKGTS